MYWWEFPNPFPLIIILFKTKKILPIKYSLHPNKNTPKQGGDGFTSLFLHPLQILSLLTLNKAC
jgi:hypothetical protein